MSPEPYCRIVELTYPEQASPGEPVRLSCKYHNEGDAGSTFCGFWDADTGDYLGGGGYGVHTPCVTGGAGIGRAMPRRELRIRVEVGGNTSNPRDPTRTVTDTRTIVIRLAPRAVVTPRVPLLVLAPIAVGLVTTFAAGKA